MDGQISSVVTHYVICHDCRVKLFSPNAVLEDFIAWITKRGWAKLKADGWHCGQCMTKMYPNWMQLVEGKINHD